MNALPFRQVHLDFHTSEHIPDVGARFNAKTFVDTLRNAHVNSVNLFAKCHHGWSYYDTKVGERHPNLSFDLLRAQYDAVKTAGIKAVIYFTCGWDERSARQHPEWRSIAPDGTFYCAGNGPSNDVHWKFLCFNTPYLDHMTAQIRELAQLFPDADGYWLDIIFGSECTCSHCIASMDAMGLDWEKAEDRRTHAYEVRDRYMRETNAAARSVNPSMPVFHNSGHLPQGDRELLAHYSHLEIESLPTGGWGYDHFPLSAAYARTLGKPYLGMTGKFHTMWGEFGGYKHPAALQYENALMNAFGAGTSIGDQLHPSGEIDQSTYALIGAAYAEAEAKEPWVLDAEPQVDIGLFSVASEQHKGETGEAARDVHSDLGAVRLLLESHHLFDVVDREADFSRYKLVILPDAVRLDAELAAKMRAYLAGGGRVLLSGDSGLAADADRMLLDVGGDVGERSSFDPDFVLAAEGVRPDFVDSPMVMYAPSHRFRTTDGVSLGDVFDPYFNRAPKHFSSHQHTPPRVEPSGYHAGARKGPVTYLAHPVFSIYWRTGAATTRQYVARVIDGILGSDRTLSTSLPSHGRATVNRQHKHKRSVVHLLCASPISRGAYAGKPIEVVEDIVTVPDVRVVVRTAQPVGRVTLEPQGRAVDFTAAGNEIRVTIDRVAGHQMVVLHDA